MNTTLRNTLKTIDSHFFAGTLKTLNRKRWKYQNSWLRYLSTKKMQVKFTSNNNICLTKNSKNYLGSLFDKHGSDKGYYLHNKDDMSGHNYNDIYELLFFQYKKQTKLVLECGIGSKNPETPSNMSSYEESVLGGILRVWRDYFPNAEIIGIDIDRCKFTEDRISTFVCDQTSKSSINNFIQQ